jgi:probable rRNA maturation factor
VSVSAATVQRLVHALDASGRFKVPVGELSIAILDATAMARVHADFLNDPTPTDVITFAGDPGLGSAGEICVCADVAWDYAREHGTELASELSLYIAHGYLHLAGYDDTTGSLRREMRRAEKTAMQVLHAEAAVLTIKRCNHPHAARSVGR